MSGFQIRYFIYLIACLISAKDHVFLNIFIINSWNRAFDQGRLRNADPGQFLFLHGRRGTERGHPHCQPCLRNGNEQEPFSVTGNAAIGGISAGYGGLSLSAGAGLDVSAVDSNAGLSMTGGVLSLGGQNTMTGNLNLGAAVRIDATHMTVNGNPLLALNGALTVNGSLLLENSDSVSWSAGRTI